MSVTWCGCVACLVFAFVSLGIILWVYFLVDLRDFLSVWVCFLDVFSCFLDVSLYSSMYPALWV